MKQYPHSLVYKILVLARAFTFWRFWDWSYKIGGLIAKIALPPSSFWEIMLQCGYLGADLTYWMYFTDLPQLYTQISQHSHNFAP